MIGYIFIGLSVVLILVLLCRPLKEEIPPLDVSLKDSKMIWGLWFTGGLYGKEILEKGKVKKVLVLDPTSNAFKANLAFTTGQIKRAKEEIYEVTRLANSKEGIIVKWYSKFQKTSVTFYDNKDGIEPSSKNAYCIYQTLSEVPISSNRKRHKLENKGKVKTDYSNMIEIFNDLWDNHSRDPDIT